MLRPGVLSRVGGETASLFGITRSKDGSGLYGAGNEYGAGPSGVVVNGAVGRVTSKRHSLVYLNLPTGVGRGSLIGLGIIGTLAVVAVPAGIKYITRGPSTGLGGTRGLPGKKGPVGPGMPVVGTGPSVKQHSRGPPG